MHQDIPHDIIKAAAGGGFAVPSWLGGQFAQAVEEAPSWVKAADTPLVILGLSYGVIHLWRELKKSQADRIADRDAFMAKLDADSNRSAEARERLIHATTVQTEEFKALRRAVEANRTPLYQNRDPQ